MWSLDPWLTVFYLPHCQHNELSVRAAMTLDCRWFLSTRNRESGIKKKFVPQLLRNTALIVGLCIMPLILGVVASLSLLEIMQHGPKHQAQWKAIFNKYLIWAMDLEKNRRSPYSDFMKKCSKANMRFCQLEGAMCKKWPTVKLILQTNQV